MILSYRGHIEVLHIPPMAPQQRTIELGTVLVVGGCGFLGSNIVDQLLNFPTENDPSAALPKVEGDSRFEYPRLTGRYPKYSAKVAVVDLRTAHNRLPGAEYYDGDITSAESMLEVFRKVKPEVVIHTASLMLDENRPLIRKVNVEGTQTLLDVASGAKGDWGGKCKAFVYTSSSSVVHDTHSDLINVNEQWPYVRGPLQKEYYSETKVGFLASDTWDEAVDTDGIYFPNRLMRKSLSSNTIVPLPTQC